MALRLRRVLRALPGGRSLPVQRGGVPRGAEQNAGLRFPDAPEPTAPFSRHLVSGAVGVVLGGLAVWGYGHVTAAKTPAVVPAAVAVAAMKAPATPAQPIETHAYTPRPRQPALDSAPIPGPRYVHRANSVLRDVAKTSGRSLKKESKGAKVQLDALEPDGWAKVTDGVTQGWMRASVLGVDPPK